MKFKDRTLTELGNLICGNPEKYFVYRSSSRLTEFFQDSDTNFVHDGGTRHRWVAEALRALLVEPQTHPNLPPESFVRVISNLMDRSDAKDEGPDRTEALAMLNKELAREGFEAFYAEDGKCYLKHVKTSTVAILSSNPHRPLTPVEIQKRNDLAVYLERISEDHLIENILLPLFRQLGFYRVTAVGHKDKQLEYGKDVWMKYTLPTTHVLYFGLQVKKGKLDAAGVSKSETANIAEIYNQVLMMLGHEIFDAEISKKVLVDHAFIVAGGEITKAARNWLGGKLDASKRSQIMFIDREDILNLFVVHNLPLPDEALPPKEGLDDLPF
jgi:hypothetical protein